MKAYQELEIDTLVSELYRGMSTAFCSSVIAIYPWLYCVTWVFQAVKIFSKAVPNYRIRNDPSRPSPWPEVNQNNRQKAPRPVHSPLNSPPNLSTRSSLRTSRSGNAFITPRTNLEADDCQDAEITGLPTPSPTVVASMLTSYSRHSGDI